MAGNAAGVKLHPDKAVAGTETVDMYADVHPRAETCHR